VTKVINETRCICITVTRATKEFEGAELAENEEMVPSYSMSFNGQGVTAYIRPLTVKIPLKRR
jgi:hypothetical protein